MVTMAGTVAQGRASWGIQAAAGGSAQALPRPLPGPQLLRQRMIDAMVLRGFAARTQEAYMGAVDLMARHYRVQAGSLNDATCRYRRTCYTCCASGGCRARR